MLSLGKSPSISPSSSRFCGYPVAEFGNSRVEPWAAAAIDHAVAMFVTEYGKRPRHLLIGGKWYSHLVQELDGYPKIVNEMKVHFVKKTQLSLHFEPPAPEEAAL